MQKETRPEHWPNYPNQPHALAWASHKKQWTRSPRIAEKLARKAENQPLAWRSQHRSHSPEGRVKGCV